MSAQPLSRRHHLGSGVVLVLVGGVVGTLLRYGVEAALPPRDGWPWGTLAANVTGAFALGALLEGLARRGPETRVGGGRDWCSAPGCSVATPPTARMPWRPTACSATVGGSLAAAYVALTLLAGLVAAAAGVRLVAGGRAGAHARGPVDPDTDDGGDVGDVGGVGDDAAGRV